MAQSYAQQLKAVGITRVISPGSGAMVHLETGYGAVYVRYPTGAEPLAFVLDIDPEGVEATERVGDFLERDADLHVVDLFFAVARVLERLGYNTLGWLRQILALHAPQGRHFRQPRSARRGPGSARGSPVRTHRTRNRRRDQRRRGRRTGRPADHPAARRRAIATMIVLFSR